MPKYQELIEFGTKLIAACNVQAPNKAHIERICKTTYDKCRSGENGPRHLHDVTDENPSDHLKATYVAVHTFGDRVLKQTGVDPYRETGSEETLGEPEGILRSQARILAELNRIQIYQDKRIPFQDVLEAKPGKQPVH